MDRPRLEGLSLLVVAVISCGPGDHETNAGLAHLFGGGAAGKTTQSHANDTADDPGDGSAAASATGGSSTLAGAGRMAAAPGINPPVIGTAGFEQTSLPNGSAGMAAVSGGITGSTAGATVNDGTNGTAGTGRLGNDSTGGPSCAVGYGVVAGQCVCDLNGTFAFHGKLPVSLPSTPPIEALSDTIEFWGLVRHRYDSQGNLAITLNSCGQSTPDICAAAQAPILPSAEAYAQYVPVEVWDTATPPAVAQMSLLGALPGAAFATPTLVELFGVTLTNPLGAWPTSRKNVDGGADFGGSATNGARWADMDGDGKLGMTIKVVGPGGVSASATGGPAHNYGAASAACPRANAQAARSPYAYLPLPQGLGVKRITGLYSAQRVKLEFHGSLETCDRISGMLTGAGGAKLQLDGLIGGCTMVNGSGEAACTSALLDSADSSGNAATTSGFELGSGSFVLARVQADTTCAQVRAMNLE